MEFQKPLYHLSKIRIDLNLYKKEHWINKADNKLIFMMNFTYRIKTRKNNIFSQTNNLLINLFSHHKTIHIVYIEIRNNNSQIII